MRAGSRSANGWVAVLAALGVACGSSGGDGTKPPPPPPATYKISGTITGATAVTVTLTGAGTGTATTDGSGAYAFTGLASGAYTVIPSRAGYIFTPASRSVTVSGADVTGRDFVAQSTHAIAGTVTGASSVTVTLSGAASATTSTGAGGAYSFPGLVNGAYTVTPSKAGFTFAPPNRPVTVAGADVTGQDFVASAVIPGTHTISGTVTGAVIEGVAVTLREGVPDTSTTTDAAGHYAFTGLADGAYSVTPSLLDGSGSYHVYAPPQRRVTVSGTDVANQDFAGTALAPFETFSATPLSATRWDGGEHYAVLDAQAALLGTAVDAPPASTAYSTNLVVSPAAWSGRLTSVRSVAQITTSSVKGDAVVRTGIDLWFQPVADRVASPDNLTRALFVRVALQESAAGLVALRQVFACTVPDCTSSQGVGTVTSGGTAWPGSGLTGIARSTPYTLSITFDTALSRFTFSLRGGSYTTAVTATIDLSSVTSPPFPIDLSQANFYRAKLFTQVRGGPAGGAGSGGAIEARLDDVEIGVGGQPPAPFDDFNSGTSFDPARWTVGGESARVASGALEILLQQRDSPAIASLALNRDLLPAPSALQAQVTVLSRSQVGPGQVGARLAATLYNDGSAGLGPAPDVSGTSSQVGDVIAQISMTDSDVSYAVVRCNVAVCSGPGATGGGVTQVVPRTSIGTVTLGTPHRLLLHWDAATHLAVFQLDELTPAVVDPTPGFPVADLPHREFWQLASHATAADAGRLDFTTGSSGEIRAKFQDVRKR